MTKAIIGMALAVIGMTPATAAASTLVLYDTSAPYGERIAASPYARQEFAQAAAKGLVRTVAVPVDDGGQNQTVVVDVVRAVPQPILGLGVRVQSRSVSWRVTTQLSDGQLRYETVVMQRQGFVNGITPPTRVVVDDAVMEGVAPVGSDAPTFVRTYQAPEGRRVMVGFVIPWNAAP
jgi:hypothetical protein